MNLPSGEICSPLMAFRLRPSVREGVCLVCPCAGWGATKKARAQRKREIFCKGHLRRSHFTRGREIMGGKQMAGAREVEPEAQRNGAPMDNAKERRYAPLGCTRGDGDRQEVEGATGHAGLDDSANATQSGVAAWIWPGAAHRADQRGSAAVERRHGVYVVATFATRGL